MAGNGGFDRGETSQRKLCPISNRAPEPIASSVAVWAKKQAEPMGLVELGRINLIASSLRTAQNEQK